MKCDLYVWILIFSFTARLNTVSSACPGAAANKANQRPPAAKNFSACLHMFMTMMNYLSVEAAKSSKECSSIAADKRSCLLSNATSTLAASVRGIQERLLVCDMKEDASNDFLDYFRCMRNTIDEVRTPLQEIGNKSTRTIDAYLTRIRAIDEEEKSCLEAVVQKTKQASDQAFVEYRDCLLATSDCVCGSSKSTTTSTSTSFTPPTEEGTSKFDTGGGVNIQPRSSRGSVDLIAVIVGAVVLVVIVLIATYLYRNNDRREFRLSRLVQMPWI